MMGPIVNKAEMKNLDAVALKKEVESLKKELFNVKLSMLSGQVKDASQFRKLRVNIAQALTFFNQKQK